MFTVIERVHHGHHRHVVSGTGETVAGALEALSADPRAYGVAGGRLGAVAAVLERMGRVESGWGRYYLADHHTGAVEGDRSEPVPVAVLGPDPDNPGRLVVLTARPVMGTHQHSIPAVDIERN